MLFEKGISARKFASTEIDVFSEAVEDKVMHNYEERMITSSNLAYTTA